MPNLFIRHLIPLLLIAAISGCVTYPDESVPLSETEKVASETYVLPLSLDEIRSRLHEHEKFCGPFPDVEPVRPDHGRWRKHSANLSGDTREVLVIELNQTDAHSTNIIGYAQDKRWLPYTKSFVGVVDNTGNCSENI